MPNEMKHLRVDLQAQFLVYRDEIRAGIDRVLASGRYVLGAEVQTFEKEFGHYLGGCEVVGVADGTRAISFAIGACGPAAGREVITTPFTAIPTIGAILEAGARPMFVDIDPDTWLLDLDQVAEAVSDRTAAIVPVHMFGNVVDIPRLQAALPRPIPIIEDAAQAHGSRLRGQHAGTMGEFGTFSFYPTKNLGGVGDGGAIVTGNAEQARLMRLRRNHGMEGKDLCVTAGFNSRLDEVQAATLRVKLPHLDAMNRARAARVAVYLDQLPVDLFRPQQTTTGAEVNHHVLQLRYAGDRDALIAALEAEGIQTNVYYVIPHHLQPALAWLGYREGDFPVLEKLCREAIALPLYPEMDFEVIHTTIGAILRHLGR